MRRTNLGDLLVQQGAVDEVQLRSALAHQRRWGLPLGQTVVRLGFCNWREVLCALSAQLGMPAVELDRVALDRSLAVLVPCRLAQRYRAIPLRLFGERRELLYVAVLAPAGLPLLDELASLTRRRIVPLVASDDAMARAIARLYAPSASSPATPRTMPSSQPHAPRTEVPVILGTALDAANDPELEGGALGPVARRAGAEDGPLAPLGEQLFELDLAG